MFLNPAKDITLNFSAKNYQFDVQVHTLGAILASKFK